MTSTRPTYLVIKLRIEGAYVPDSYASVSYYNSYDEAFAYALQNALEQYEHQANIIEDNCEPLKNVTVPYEEKYWTGDEYDYNVSLYIRKDKCCVELNQADNSSRWDSWNWTIDKIP